MLASGYGTGSRKEIAAISLKLTKKQLFQFQHELQVLKTTFYSASFLKPQKTTHLHRVFSTKLPPLPRHYSWKLLEERRWSLWTPQKNRDFGDGFCPKLWEKPGLEKYGWRENGGKDIFLLFLETNFFSLKPTISMATQWGCMVGYGEVFQPTICI